MPHRKTSNDIGGNMLQTTLASIPEAREEYPSSSLAERTGRIGTFSDLGPADLCNIHKTSINSKKKDADFGTFLYYTGVDTSNSASIAAHLQSLANLITSKSQYWFGEKKHWRVPQLTYCSYNAFSAVDMRVTVHIPGKFESSVISSEGKPLTELTTEQLDQFWLETFISSMVRSFLDSDEDDPNKIGGLVEIRRINPLYNGTSSRSLLSAFLDGFEKLFFVGPKLGASINIPQPTVISNYLVDAFIKSVELTQNFDQALEILTRLQKIEPAVITLITKIYLLKDEEIKAVQLMSEGINENKRNSDLLLLQTEFCIKKKRYDLALDSAKQTVKSSPSEFNTWANLVEVYTKLNDFENALLTLNSCPMNSHKEKFYLKRIVTLKLGNTDLHLPAPVDVTLDEVSNLQSLEIHQEQRNLDPNLMNLPAANLKSTFAKGYDLLTEIVVKTGWEALLKYRAKVFVMEEEYRKDRHSTANGHGNVRSTASIAEDIASTTGLKSPGTEQEEFIGKTDLDQEFKKKRLCERWLDNLFMLLYEDLRAYTMWQAESLHFQAQQMEYRKTTLEWETLGSIAFRLKHFKEGSVAFNNALTGRFSAKSQKEILKYYIMERTKLITRNGTNNANSVNYTKVINQLNEKILESVVKLLVWNHRWYSEFSPPLIITLSDLVAKEGLIKTQSIVQALYSENPKQTEANSNKGITDLVEDLFNFLKQYNANGSDN